MGSAVELVNARRRRGEGDGKGVRGGERVGGHAGRAANRADDQGVAIGVHGSIPDRHVPQGDGHRSDHGTAHLEFESTAIDYPDCGGGGR